MLPSSVGTTNRDTASPKPHWVRRSVEVEGGVGKPVGVVVSGDGKRLFVANGAVNRVTTLDAATLKPVGSVRVGGRPWGIARSADSRFVYTANGITGDVSIVDARANREVGRIKVGARPWGITVVLPSR